MFDGSRSAAVVERYSAPARSIGMLAMGLPAGRRSPSGRMRWYAACADEGREQAVADRLLGLVSREVLSDAFVLRREKWEKHSGSWGVVEKPLYRGYLFLASPDAPALVDALSHLSFPVRLAGGQGRGYLPLDPAAQAWFSAAMDSRHVIRSSTAVMVDGRLWVLDGPLVGQETSIGDVDRRRRTCLVRIGHADGAFEELMPLDIPFKGTAEVYADWLVAGGCPDFSNVLSSDGTSRASKPRGTTHLTGAPHGAPA